MIPWLYIMQFGFGADSIFTSYTYVICTALVIIGGNLVRLSKESGMQKTRLISLD